MPLPLIAPALLLVGKLLGKLFRFLRFRGRKHPRPPNGRVANMGVMPVHHGPTPPDKPDISQAVEDIPKRLFEKHAPPLNISVNSQPSDAGICVDGHYSGSTPSTIPLTPGKHKISIKKKGRKRWRETLTVAGEGQRIHAELKKSWF